MLCVDCLMLFLKLYSDNQSFKVYSMYRYLLFLLIALAAGHASADTLYSVKITKVYTQSRAESDAHLIQLDRTIEAVCSGNRLYIDLADKELYAAALTLYLSGKPVDVIYIPAAVPRTAAGHTNIPCKVISLF